MAEIKWANVRSCRWKDFGAYRLFFKVSDYSQGDGRDAKMYVAVFVSLFKGTVYRGTVESEET